MRAIAVVLALVNFGVAVTLFSLLSPGNGEQPLKVLVGLACLTLLNAVVLFGRR